MIHERYEEWNTPRKRAWIRDTCSWEAILIIRIYFGFWSWISPKGHYFSNQTQMANHKTQFFILHLIVPSLINNNITDSNLGIVL